MRSSPAMLFDEIISFVQGMYLVRPEVVPDVTAKNGTRDGPQIRKGVTPVSFPEILILAQRHARLELRHAADRFEIVITPGCRPACPYHQPEQLPLLNVRSIHRGQLAKPPPAVDPDKRCDVQHDSSLCHGRAQTPVTFRNNRSSSVDSGSVRFAVIAPSWSRTVGVIRSSISAPASVRYNS